MTPDWKHGILIGAVILAAATPYSARIRRPDQKPLAAYLISVTVFVASAVVLFSLAACSKKGDILLFSPMPPEPGHAKT
jgi:hypothetical protein